MGLDIPRPDAHGSPPIRGITKALQQTVADIGSSRTAAASRSQSSTHTLTQIVTEPKSALALLTKASGAFFMLEYRGLSSDGAHVFKGNGFSVMARGDIKAANGQLFSAQLLGRGAQGTLALHLGVNVNSANAWLYQQSTSSFMEALYRFFSLSSNRRTLSAYGMSSLVPSKRQAASSVLQAASESKGLSLSEDVFEDLLAIMLNEGSDDSSSKGHTGNEEPREQDEKEPKENLQAEAEHFSIQDFDYGSPELHWLIRSILDPQAVSASTAAALDAFNAATDNLGRRWQIFPLKTQENGIALKGHLRLLLEGKGSRFSESMQRMALELKSEDRTWHFYASSAFSGNLSIHGFVTPWPEDTLHQLEARLTQVFSAAPIRVRMTYGEPPLDFMDCLENGHAVVDERA